MLNRAAHLDRLESLLALNPVVAILGPRQIGKTTLARQLVARNSGPAVVFDLENPRDLSRLEDPMLALEGIRGLVVVDEIQRRPNLFPVLRVLADRPRSGTRFLVLGSASPDLLRQTAETLAGRIAYHELTGLGLDEVGAGKAGQLWLRGGFPRSFLAKTVTQSIEWRRGFIRDFLERDLPELGVRTSSVTLRRFWSMLAHSHGQTWNSSEFARAFGVADTSVRRYLDVLTATFVVRQLPSWFENLGKRQVKAPKIYVADSGLLHALLDIGSSRDLDGHPKIGASWEGFAIGVVIRRLGARSDECYFWRTHTGAELDLLVVRGRKRLGFEFKRTSSPSMTPSMRSALGDLKLERLDVVYAGDTTYSIAPRVRAIGLARVLEDLAPLR